MLLATESSMSVKAIVAVSMSVVDLPTIILLLVSPMEISMAYPL